MISDTGENFGVLKKEEALKKAQELGLDLIEISPTAKPPVAKIMDLGKYLYQQQKKEKEAAKKAHEVEIKIIQFSLGISLHDLEMRAKQAEEFLREGNRVKIDLVLKGRSKYLDKNFINERFHRLLNLISEKHKIADGPKKVPKGLTAIIEKVK